MDTFLTVIYIIFAIIGILVLSPFIKTGFLILKACFLYFVWCLNVMINFICTISFIVFIALIIYAMIKNDGIKLEEEKYFPEHPVNSNHENSSTDSKQ